MIWKQRRLGNLAKIVRGASPRPISDPKWFDDGSDIGWLRISDVTSQNGRIHHLKQHISKLGQEKTRVITEPHLLLSIAATVGKPVINYVKTGVHDGFLIFLEPNFDLEYMYQWLEMFRPKWNKYGQPGSQVNLNSDLVKNQKIILPSKVEQEKIRLFLKCFDSLIDLLQRKQKQLQHLKKAMSQKMFPKNDSQVPEIRFNGFRDVWKQKKLKSVVKDQIKGKGKINELQPGNIKYLDTSSLNGGKNLLVSGAQDVNINDIIILWDGSKAGTVYTNFSGILGSTLKAYKLSDSNNFFVYEYLKLRQKDIYANYRTPNIPHVQKNFLDIFFIPITKLNEQNKVGNLFHQFDKLIVRNQQKLDHLIQIKKYLIQKMFI